jgi:PPM family protein phosphatase
VPFTGATGSDVGHRYSENYDRAHLALDPVRAVVADAMGDGPGSAYASSTTVSLLAAAPADPAGLRGAVAEAHRRLRAYADETTALTGCTLTAVAEGPDGVWLAQLGDSRLYRLRRGLLELLTVDHTVAWLGAVHGWFPFDSPQAHSARYQLTRYTGHSAAPAPDLLHLDVEPRDVLLLCTDGIAEQVPYARIATALARPTPDAAVADLLAAADSAGGTDNATAIVLHATP